MGIELNLTIRLVVEMRHWESEVCDPFRILQQKRISQSLRHNKPFIIRLEKKLISKAGKLPMTVGNREKKQNSVWNMKF